VEKDMMMKGGKQVA